MTLKRWAYVLVGKYANPVRVYLDLDVAQQDLDSTGFERQGPKSCVWKRGKTVYRLLPVMIYPVK